MKNVQIMTLLLEEMSKYSSGQIILLNTYGQSEEDQQRRHNAQLLVDEGFARWTTDKEEILEITSNGYRFLIERNNRLKQKPRNPIGF